MKLQVLHDAKGTILEVDVPAEHGKTDLATVCTTLRVDAKRRTLVALPKRAARAGSKPR